MDVKKGRTERKTRAGRDPEWAKAKKRSHLNTEDVRLAQALGFKPKRECSPSTNTRTAAGAVAFMSPKQAQGEPPEGHLVSGGLRWSTRATSTTRRR